MIGRHTIAEGMLRHAAERPEATAIRCHGMQVSYGQLRQESLDLAQVLVRQGLAGQRIGIWMQNHPHVLSCFYGIVLGGGIAVPLPHDLPEAQLADWQEHLQLATVWKKRPTFGTGECQPLPASIPDTADALFYMAVSSGSTGRPKGILRSHRSWLESFSAMERVFGVGRDDRLLLPGQLAYSANLIAALQVLHTGGEVILLPRFRPAETLQHLMGGEVTATFMVPSMYAKILAASNQQTGSIRNRERLICITAGDKMAADVKRRWLSLFPECQLYEYYGAAELSFVTVLTAEEQWLRQGSVGRPFAGVELMILDQQGQPLPPGAAGEVYVKSRMIAQGYGHQGAEAFLQPLDGAFSVGDIGYLDDAGYLCLIGRRQELIIRGGVNLYPAEIEKVLHAREEIAAACVFGQPDPVLGERVIAAIVPQRHTDASVLTSREAWFGKLAGWLAPSRQPDEYWLTDELPLNSAGKVDRLALIRRYQEERGESHA